MKTKTIKQTIIFKASPHEVYEALMDSEKHAKFSGDEAKISREVGGKFTAYGSYINGENLELVPDKKIVQNWQAAEDGWPKDHYSKVIFELEKIKEGTKLIFTQADVPAENYEDIKQGWVDYYWQPMKEMLERR